MESLRDPRFLSVKEHGNSGIQEMWRRVREIGGKREDKLRHMGASNLNSDEVLWIQETYILRFGEAE